MFGKKDEVAPLKMMTTDGVTPAISIYKKCHSHCDFGPPNMNEGPKTMIQGMLPPPMAIAEEECKKQSYAIP